MSKWAVEVQNLCVRFGDFYAVNDVSFSVSQGEIFGFLGANGAGKTTAIRVLCGLLTPTSGRVRVAGIALESGERQIKTRVGYMSQKFTLYNDMTVEENLDFIAALRKIDRHVYLKRRSELFEFISWDRPLRTSVQDLPGGIKQQVSLAAALLHDPEIIFLDEPTAGVSPASRARFWALIRNLASQGKTLFVTTHYMDEAEQCQRIALMREGKIIAIDSPVGLKKSVFPMPVYEFDPKSPLNFDEILKLESEENFSFFEPYGLRFHASVVSQQRFEKDRSRYDSQFHIREIEPSLEDVFIRSVEARES